MSKQLPALTPATLFWSCLVGAALVASPFILTGCELGGGNGDPLGPTAELTMQLKRDDGTATLVDYNVNITWQGEVTQETGSEGATSFDETKNYTGDTDLNGDWTAKGIWLERRPGTWELRVVNADGWSHTCQPIELVEDQMTVVSITWGENECNVGPFFP